MNKTIEMKHLLWVLYCLKYFIYFIIKITKKWNLNKRLNLLTIKLTSNLELNYIFCKKKKLAHAYFRRRIFPKSWREN